MAALATAKTIASLRKAPNRPPLYIYDLLVQGGLQKYAVRALRATIAAEKGSADIIVEGSAVGVGRDSGEFVSLAEVEAELHAGDVICGTLLGKAAVGLIRVTSTGEPISNAVAHHPGR